MVEVGLRAMPTAVYFVNLHNGCKVTQQSTLTGKQSQWRNTQWLLAQRECSNPTYLAPKITNTPKMDLGASTPTTREQTLSLTGH